MKKLIVIYPKLEAKRAYHGETAHDIAVLLGVSDDSARRRLRGEVELDLSDIEKLMNHYESTFEELFGRDNAAVAK
jgi:transcriptional regulator with XRE-family HTH domain